MVSPQYPVHDGWPALQTFNRAEPAGPLMKLKRFQKLTLLNSTSHISPAGGGFFKMPIALLVAVECHRANNK